LPYFQKEISGKECSLPLTFILQEEVVMKNISTLVLVLGMLFVSVLNTGCSRKGPLDPDTPNTPAAAGDPTAVPTIVVVPPTTPTTPVTTPVTPVVTPVTHAYRIEFTAPAGTAFGAWSDKFTGAPYTVTRQSYVVPTGGKWAAIDTIVSGVEVYHGELICPSSPGSVQIYKDGSMHGSATSLAAGQLYTVNLNN
jgi:predicted small lipoprotein YifL